MDTQPMRWFAMTHLNPSLIEIMLRKENEGAFLKEPDEQPLQPFKYFIPFRFMQRSHSDLLPVKGSGADEVYEPRKDENGLRDDLHNFVFVYADADRVRKLVDAAWNRSSRLHLHFYRDVSGHEVIVPDAEMQGFIGILQERQIKFTIGLPVAEAEVNDHAIIKEGPMAGRRGVITDIRYTRKGVRLTLAVNMFNNTHSISFPNLREGDVIFVDRKVKNLIGTNFIHNLEEELVEIFSHHYGSKVSADAARKDQSRLERIYHYSNVKVNDPENRSRFKALMLICSSLRTYQEDKELLLDEVQNLLGDKTEARKPLDAYLMMALFIANRQPALRDAVKIYRQTHPDCPEIICRFLSIAKKIRCR